MKQNRMRKRVIVTAILALALGLILGSAAADENGIAIYVEQGKLMKGGAEWTKQGSCYILGNGTYYLAANINLEETIQVCIQIEGTVTLDLNGKTLSRGLGTARSGGHVLAVHNGAVFTLIDPKRGGKTTGGYSSGNAGGGSV